jgi:hypothetical protein
MEAGPGPRAAESVDGALWSGLRICPRFMHDGADSSAFARATRETSQSAFALFGTALRERPVRTAFGLFAEWGMFAAAVFLALSLYLTRVPLRLVDRALGLRLRERFVELIARVSPG